jgi:Ca2+-binding EF-hand superfamily protein
MILNDLRGQLKRRGASGIIGLGRKFKIMDDDGSSSIDLSEFTKAMHECELNLNDAELSALFRLFDRDGGGNLDYGE